jgi:hypothetical protein
MEGFSVSEGETQAGQVDAELEKKLALYQQLKPLASEYEKLKKELKPLFQGTERIVIGRFVVTGSWKEMKEKTIPACRYWDLKVKEKIDVALIAAAQEGGA